MKLIALCFFLPVAVPTLFGWIHGLLAVPVFFHLQTSEDEKKAKEHIRNGLLLAILGSLLLNQLVLMLFSLTMLPLGWSLYCSSQGGEEPDEAGKKGILILALVWFGFWTVYGIIAGTNPYPELLTVMDTTFDQVLALYRTSSDLPPEALYKLEVLITGIQDFFPRILPGLLASSVILTVWLNMVVTNTLLHRLQPEKAVWPLFREWHLPDKLVWLIIAAAALSLVGSGSVKDTGYSLIIVSVVLYFMQGMAVFLHFLNRWNVPRFVRIMLYVLLVVQSYGMILLAVVGVADIWSDFRKLGTEEE